jgi:hypothetical protein
VLTKTKKANVRGQTAALEIHPDRKLIARLEASRVIGCSPKTLQRMEKRNGGILDPVKLRGPASTTYYKVEQINAAFGIDVNAPNKAA